MDKHYYTFTKTFKTKLELKEEITSLLKEVYKINELMPYIEGIKYKNLDKEEKTFTITIVNPKRYGEHYIYTKSDNTSFICNKNKYNYLFKIFSRLLEGER